MADTWPTVSARAVAALRRRGVSDEIAEDAVLEAITRAIARDVPFSDADDLLRWVHVVAWRIVLDDRKRDRRLVYDTPDRVAPDDPSLVAELRLRVEKLARLVSGLSVSDHNALFAVVEPALDRRDATRLAVRRHRVRAKLLRMLEGAAAAAAWLRRRGRRPHRGNVVAAATVAPVMLLSLAVLLPHDIPQPEPVASDPGAVTAAETIRVDAPSAPPTPTGAVAGVNTSRRSPAAPPRTGLPRVDVAHPGPFGNGHAWGRAKEPDDHLACAQLSVVGAFCIDAPVQLTG
ncbi:MAG TPA: hypothetical protein VHD87_00110 [Acidimicrobiales bacterium]|nr:hypothetical protein [Acidimicrobiales bacterium]